MPSLGHCKFTWNSANNLWTLWPLPDKMKHKEITLTLTPKHFQSYIKVKCTPAYLSLQKDILFYSVLICCVLSFQYQTSPQSRFRSLLNNPEARVEKKTNTILRSWEEPDSERKPSSSGWQYRGVLVRLSTGARLRLVHKHNSTSWSRGSGWIRLFFRNFLHCDQSVSMDSSN